MKVLCTCGEYHDFEQEECSMCIPPKEVLIFGSYHIDSVYREELYNECPFYTTEEIVGSYIGENPNYPSYDIWRIQRDSYRACMDEEEEQSDESEEDSGISGWTTSGSDEEDEEDSE